MYRRVVFAALLAPLVLAWEDCDVSPPTSDGPFVTAFFTDYEYHGHPIYLQYPTALPPKGAAGWPAVVFMHGMTLGWEWYARNVEHWASHGFVVAFPFVKGQADDDAVFPIVTQTDASSIYAAVGLLGQLAKGMLAKPPGMQGALDMKTIGIAGHSMGGENAIRAGAMMTVPLGMPPLPAGAVKVTIAQHPALCTFPPPAPAHILKTEIDAASKNGALLLFTSENDRAFLPGTPSTEHTCWQAATGPSIFMNFKTSVCALYPPCDSMTNATSCTAKNILFGGGHMCACSAPGLDTWTSPQQKWVTTALRLYLHHGNATSSACSALLWGDTEKSLRRDPNAAAVDIHGGKQIEAATLVV